MNIEEFLSRLEGVKKTGDRKYMACCSAHNDSDPSMAVTEATDGRILVHCYAGCSAGEIMGSLGLSLSDLFPEGAIDHNLKGATPWIAKERKKERNWRDYALQILATAEANRKAGIKLSAKDMDLERRAFVYIKNNPASA